jgi:hypothetical protein
MTDLSLDNTKTEVSAWQKILLKYVELLPYGYSSPISTKLCIRLIDPLSNRQGSESTACGS